MPQWSESIWLQHQDGVPWYRAPLPSRRHDCSAWTLGKPYPYETWVLGRCRCGARKWSFAEDWSDVNQRRKQGIVFYTNL